MEIKEVRKYVLDTSVLVSDPDALFKFDEHEVILPITTISEIDNLKKDQREVGRSARAISRKLSELCDKFGNLNTPVVINDKGGTLRVCIRHSSSVNLPLDFNDKYLGNDNKIINTAYINNAIVVSKDNNLRITALAYGVQAEDYKHEKLDVTDLYDGVGEFWITDEELDALYEKGYMNYNQKYHESSEIYPNQCFIVKSIDNPKHSALTIYNSNMKEYRLIPQDLKTMDIMPRNSEQQFALSLLLDPNIKVITITGKAGSGKGVCSLAAALKGTIGDGGLYQKIVIARPIVSLNNSHQLGFAPGSIDEKLSHWLKPFYENINFILSSYTKPIKPKKPIGKRKKDLASYDDEIEKEAGRTSFVDELIGFGLLELCSLEHIKGRSIHNQIVIITEAQNCSLADIKTIVTRIGEGSKIIIEGDVDQIDTPYLDVSNNGLTHVAEKLKPFDISAHITLKKSERSLVAEIAASVL